MDGRDFTEIMNEYAIEWAHQNSIEIDVNVHGHPELALEVTQTLYRIMQEALANIARHSSASNVNVSLNCGESVKLTITDDGCGFETYNQHDGMGLQSMRERTAALKGECIIESSPGEGTRVYVTIPIS